MTMKGDMNIDNMNTLVLKEISEEEVRQLAYQLVSIRSDPQAGTREIVNWLEQFLRREGISAQIEQVAEGKHANLIVEIPGGTAGTRLLLNGHLDTVPPTPGIHSPRLDNERLYGRGATDMKSAVAAMCMALVALHRAQVKLNRGVMLAAVAGEEIGGIGTKAFLDSGRKAEMAIVGEPTRLRLVTAHKGIEWAKIELQGKSAHASCLEEGINAVIAGAKVVQALEKASIRCKNNPPHPLLGLPTLNVGVINGGTLPNTVPEQCTIQIDYRWLPNETIEEIYRNLNSVVVSSLKNYSQIHFNISRMEETKHCLPVEIPINHLLVRTIQKILGGAGYFSEPVGAPYSSDATWLTRFHIPSVIWGPGDISQAHSNNEFIELEQIWRATKFYLEAILLLCTDNDVPEL